MASVYKFTANIKREDLLKRGDEIDGFINGDKLLIFHHKGWFLDDLKHYTLKEAKNVII
jgi:hypothetical protein